MKTQIKHSETKSAWNIIGTIPGGKYKIARIPYIAVTNEELCTRERKEALIHAKFIKYCFENYYDEYINKEKKK